MGKDVYIIGLVIVMALLLGGCARQAADTDIRSVERSGSKAELPYAEELEEDVQAEPSEELVLPEEMIAEAEETLPVEEEGDIGISDSDLESLREEIEGMEFEDLGGLSE